jgi:cytochrome c-type biogenesis protein CcmH
MLWLIIIFLTCLAILAVLLPLASRKGPIVAPPSNMSFYKRELLDVRRDLDCGLINLEEAEVMRAEAARRLLLRENDAQQPVRESNHARTIIATVVCLFIPAFSVPFYMRLGHQDMPDQPLHKRIASIPGHRDTLSRISELEAFIRKHPKNGRAYEMIAPFYQRERRLDDAVTALEAALRHLGVSAPLLSSLGEAKVVAAQGQVPPEAVKDFEEALKIDPKEISARYYLGVAAAQSGDKEKASKIWTVLLADAPEGADWAQQVMNDLQQLKNGSKE